MSVGLSVSLCPLAHEQLRSNFKVELRWLLITELTQIFMCDSLCLLYVVDNVVNYMVSPELYHVFLWGLMYTWYRVGLY